MVILARSCGLGATFNKSAPTNLKLDRVGGIEASVEERDRIQKAELERQKRDRRKAQRIAVGSLVAVIISSGLGLIAWQKTRQAEYNQAEPLARYHPQWQDFGFRELGQDHQSLGL